MKIYLKPECEVLTNLPVLNICATSADPSTIEDVTFVDYGEI